MRMIGKKLTVLIVAATIILLVAAYYMMPLENTRREINGFMQLPKAMKKTDILWK